MKQFNLTFLLTVLLSMMNFDAFAHDIAVENSDGVTIYYTFQNNNTELAVCNRNGYSTSYSGHVTIPESVTYDGTTYPVTGIASYALDRCYALMSITIPKSVISIGNGAFNGCSVLMNVTIHCQTIENWFSELKSIKNVFIGDEVTSLVAMHFFAVVV
jgi:hypothetical protein